MNRHSIYKIYSIFLMFVSSSCVAQISSIHIVEDANATMYSQIRLTGGRDFFAIPRIDGEKYAVELFSLENDTNSIARVNMPYPPIFMLQSHATDLIIGADGNAMWYADQISEAIKIGRRTKLVGLSIVTSAIKVSDGYVVGGSSLDDKPLLIHLDKYLVEKKRLLMNSSPNGEAVVFAAEGGEIINIFNHDNGISVLTWLDSSFNVIKSLKLLGGAATGLLGRDGILVAYTSKENVITAEAFDKAGKSRWRSRVFERSGTSTAKFQIYELKHGYGLVGANRSALAVARIAPDGTVSYLAVDQSALSPPSGVSYTVIVRGADIHIFGVGYKNGPAASTLPYRFHMLARVGD